MLENKKFMTMLPAVDMAESRRFYADTLGLKVLQTDPNADPTSLLLQGGDSYILSREPTTNVKPIIGWSLDNFDEAVEALQNRGVVLETFPEMAGIDWDERGVGVVGPIRTAFIRDPSGNLLLLNNGYE